MQPNVRTFVRRKTFEGSGEYSAIFDMHVELFTLSIKTHYFGAEIFMRTSSERVFSNAGKRYPK